MYGQVRNPGFRPLGRFAPIAADLGLRPETHNQFPNKWKSPAIAKTLKLFLLWIAL